MVFRGYDDTLKCLTVVVVKPNYFQLIISQSATVIITKPSFCFTCNVRRMRIAVRGGKNPDDIKRHLVNQKR